MIYFQRKALGTAIQNQLLAKITTNFGSLTNHQRRDIVANLIAS
jgi:hypothetical protein